MNIGILLLIIALVLPWFIMKFKASGNPASRQQPEDLYKITITDDLIMVEHPKWDMGSVQRKNIHTISLINTDRGPWQPDVWLMLIDDHGRCMIPQGSKGYEEVYDIVSKHEGFNFENAIRSMTCTDNAEFLLWTNNPGNT